MNLRDSKNNTGVHSRAGSKKKRKSKMSKILGQTLKSKKPVPSIQVTEPKKKAKANKALNIEESSVNFDHMHFKSLDYDKYRKTSKNSIVNNKSINSDRRSRAGIGSQNLYKKQKLVSNSRKQSIVDQSRKNSTTSSRKKRKIVNSLGIVSKHSKNVFNLNSS
jgi:hypothetical protein